MPLSAADLPHSSRWPGYKGGSKVYSRGSAVSTCSKCGRRKQAQGSASLTQWLLLCNCDAAPASEPVKTRLCPDCGKRMDTARPGSFTQWIFFSDVCTCKIGAGLEPRADNDGLAHLEATLEESLDEDEIALESGAFPVERYKPLQLLGSGASSNVYLCRDRMLQKKIAVKTLLRRSRQELVLFHKEARANSSLRHPNIVQVLDFGATADGSPFMV